MSFLFIFSLFYIKFDKKIIILRFIISFFLIIGFTSNIFGQCNPNPIFLASPLPGVYPPSLPIPNIPLVGINDGQQGAPYSQTLTLVAPDTDTILDVGFLLPASVVTVMNSFGISTTMSVDINHVAYDVQGLPNGLNWQCDQNPSTTCMYNSSVNGCIAISGTPTQSGTFSVPVTMTIQIQIPSIPNPIPGSNPIFGGMSADLPTFNAVEYDLLIDGSSSTYNKEDVQTRIFPNPANSIINLEINDISNVEIYDLLGKKIKEKNNIQGSFIINVSDINKGVFYIVVNSTENQEIHQLIIK
tara:strand:+ start:104 stop:1003 length:900 start_codon:yes stop_codon:yes gene_type:complete